MKYKTPIALITILAIGLGLSAFMPQEQKYQAKNLKVLPNDISKEELDEIMDEFKIALGVKCSHCHASQANDPTKLDFASDEKIEKEIARKMMEMTAEINKNFFQWKGEDGLMRNINCMTCHNGDKSPETIAISPEA